MDAWNIYTTFLFGRQAWPNFQGQNSLLLDLKVPNSQNCQVDIRHHWIPCLDVATPVMARTAGCKFISPEMSAWGAWPRYPPGSTAVRLWGKCWGNPQWDGTPGCVIRPVSTWRCFRVSQEYHFPFGILGRCKDSKMLNPLRSREEPAGFSQEKRRLAGPWNKQRAVTPQNQWLVQMIPLLLGPWPIFRRRFAVSLREGNWWMPKISEAYRECEYSQAEWPVLQDLVGNVSMISRLMIKWWSVVDSETVWEI